MVKNKEKIGVITIATSHYHCWNCQKGVAYANYSEEDLMELKGLCEKCYDDKTSKTSKVKAKYKSRAKTRLCKNCHYFIKGRPNTCSKVTGKINPSGSCMYWYGR